ncbi:hypothetical protein [Rhizobacter sp. LjRoot28]|uniref:hypothetical protein n=1 Tax=Rhizobacter sp. LjRoot28 TaxID=3342309 RepID=UPI003ED0664A
MAIGNLITALKVVPWGDVINAAPSIVKGARKMFSRTEEAAPVTAPVPTGEPPERLARLEVQLREMGEREQASAKLIEALAEQNAAIVATLSILRARARWLVAINLVLLALLGGGLAWVALAAR